MSVPPYLPEQPIGGFDIDPTANGTNNDCGAAGSNIVHMQWEETVVATTTFVANYRFVVDGETARVHRVLCQSADGGASFTTFSDRPISPEVASATVPVASITLDPASGDVAVLSFELADRDAAAAFLGRLRTARVATSLGGPETIVCHPSTSTHASLTPEEKQAAGVREGLLRVSVGLEDCADLVADFEQALEPRP